MTEWKKPAGGGRYEKTVTYEEDSRIINEFKQKEQVY